MTSIMITLDSIRKPVLRELESYEAFVERQFTAEGDLLNEMLREALASRGKGVRPLLVALSAALNGRTEGAAGSPRVSLAAMLVEMIHLASLIHDDVIDESDTRRGRPSINARWQSHKAVLLGDFILARNMAIGLQSGQFDLVSHICGSMVALCEGEVLQSDCASKQNMTLRAYLDIVYKKTATLLGVSASAGAMAVGAVREKVSTMRRFGESLGVAFQIQDDILDYTPEAQTGKPSNNDLREGKITLPLLILLDRADAERRAELLALLQRCREDDEAVQQMQQLVVAEGGLQEAQTMMQGYVNKAVNILSEYEDSPYRTSLVHLCSYIMERNK